jgi:hypothetical protein
MVAHGQGSKPLWDTEGSWGQRTTSLATMRGWPLWPGIIFCSGRKACNAFYWYAWNDKSYGTLYNFPTQTVERAGVAYAQVKSWLVGATLTAPCSVSTSRLGHVI